MYGRKLFAQSIHPAKETTGLKNAIIFGFDTEFRYDNQELICFQLAYEDRTEIYRPPLSWQRLREECECLSGMKLNHKHTWYLSCFFSMSEAQHLPRTRTRWQQWFAGSYDVTHKLDEYRKLKLCDLAQWFAKQSLSDAAELFGLRKKEFNVCRATERLFSSREFKEYAKHDAYLAREIFVRLREAVWKLMGVDILVYRTAAAASLRHFRERWVTEDINNPSMMLRTLALESKHGGAMMNYYRGELKGQFYEYDAFSQYPQAAVALGKMPRARDWQRMYSLEECRSAIGGLLEVEFRYPEKFRYPSLVVSTVKGNCYPLSGITCCTLSEVKLARKQGAEVHLLRGWAYFDGTNTLSKYMKRLMKLRGKCRIAQESYLYKKFMNALLGKFGQTLESFEISELEKCAERYSMSVEEFCSIVGLADRVVKRRIHLGAGYIPEWYALVTGKARASVLEAAWKNEALAVVVDSILTDRPMTKNRYAGIRYDVRIVAERYVAYRELFYALFNSEGIPVKIAHQGTPTNAVVRRALSRFDQKKKELNYERERLIKFRESLRKGKRLGSISIEQCKKNLLYAKGNLRHDGSGWIEPFRVAPR